MTFELYLYGRYSHWFGQVGPTRNTQDATKRIGFGHVGIVLPVVLSIYVLRQMLWPSPFGGQIDLSRQEVDPVEVET